MDNGNLFEIIKQSKTGISEEDAWYYFNQVLNAVIYLHDNHLVHRDIKPENLLMDKQGNVKLCDFGWCVKTKKENRKTFCGTYEYMAPEIIKETKYGVQIDIWSLGILLFEMLHGYSPFKLDEESDDDEKILQCILTEDFEINDGISFECKDLIQSKTNLN